MTDREALRLMLGRAGVKFAETQRDHKKAVFSYEIRVPDREEGPKATFTFNQWGDLQEFRLLSEEDG